MAGELIFVTGGTGFLGHDLVHTLLDAGYRVRLLVRENSDLSHLDLHRIETVIGDVTDVSSLQGALAGCQYVVHAAGFFRFWGPYEEFDQINVDGTRNVVQAAIQAKVAKMIYISSIAVVGNPRPGEVIDEHTACHPQDPYQHSKLAAEHYLLSMAALDSFPVVILRPGAFYGPGSRYGFNRLFIEEPMRGWRVKVDGGWRLTFPAYVPDVARAIVLALQKGRNGEIYHVADRSLSHNELNKIVSQLLGISTWRLSVRRTPMILLAALFEVFSTISGREPFYPLNLRHYVFNDWDVSSEKARNELGFEPTPIEEGLASTVAWYQGNYDGSAGVKTL